MAGRGPAGRTFHKPGQYRELVFHAMRAFGRLGALNQQRPVNGNARYARDAETVRDGCWRKSHRLLLDGSGISPIDEPGSSIMKISRVLGVTTAGLGPNWE
jgi:hypothetical protein